MHDDEAGHLAADAMTAGSTIRLNALLDVGQEFLVGDPHCFAIVTGMLEEFIEKTSCFKCFLASVFVQPLTA